MSSNIQNFDSLPDSALIDVQAIATYLSRGVSTIWRDLKLDPDFPRPVRLSARCTRFRVGDVRRYIAGKAEA